jgi:hypothetical protein
VTQLDVIENLQKRHDINFDFKLSQVRDEIVQLVKEAQKDGDLHAASRAAQIAKLGVLQKQHTVRARQTAIIRSLHFEVLNKRWRDIPEADRSSNDWLFHPNATSFVSWLEHETGIFLISGKVRVKFWYLTTFADCFTNILRPAVGSPRS